MFKTSTSLLVGVLAIAAGVVTIIFNNSITSTGVVCCGGVLFVIAAVLNAVITYFAKDDKGRRRAGTVAFLFNMVASAAALAFGICMIFRPDIFVRFIPIVFSILVLFGALMLFYYLSYGRRPSALPRWLFAYPLLVLVGAVIVFCLEGQTDDHLIMIYTGASLIVYGLGMGSIGVALERQRKARTSRAKTPAEPAKTLAEPSKAEASSSDKASSSEPKGLE